MPFFNTEKSAILGDYFGSSATKMGTPLEVALSTTEPDCDGTGITEPVGGSYSRFDIANTDSEWEQSVNGDYVSNLNEVDFGIATGDWGEITHFVIFQSGTPRFFGFISDINGNQMTKEIFTDDHFVFPVGGLKIQLPPIAA